MCAIERDKLSLRLNFTFVDSFRKSQLASIVLMRRFASFVWFAQIEKTALEAINLKRFLTDVSANKNNLKFYSRSRSLFAEVDY